jgi:hypothetical protein
MGGTVCRGNAVCGPPVQRRETFWLPGYYDLNIHGAEKKIGKINYIHMNPVKRGLVKKPEDWK